MLTFLIRGYSKEELYTAADLLEQASTMLQARECLLIEPHCPTCDSQHLCGDLCRTTRWLRMKAGSAGLIGTKK